MFSVGSYAVVTGVPFKTQKWMIGKIALINRILDLGEHRFEIRIGCVGIRVSQEMLDPISVEDIVDRLNKTI